MTTPPISTMSLTRSTSARLALAAALGAIALAGCAPNYREQGSSGTLATYSGTTLSTNVPHDVRVPAVIAAADQVVRARGYAVDKTEATEEKGTLVCRAPRYNNYPRVIITAERQDTATHVKLRVEPFGNEEQCRSILNGMLEKLGL
jgi:hypothetical protein